MSILAILAASAALQSAPGAGEAAFAAVERCYVFMRDGDAAAMTDWLNQAGFASGPDGRHRLSGGDVVLGFQASPSRACGLDLVAQPVDAALMERVETLLRRNRRGFSGSQETTGFACIMHSVTVRSRAIEARADCNRLAGPGQPWLSVRLTAAPSR